MRALRRYLRLAAVFAGASISAQLEYRANFIVSVLNAALMTGGALFGLLLLTSDGQPVGGWSFFESVVVVGLFTMVQGFIGAVLYPNLSKLSEEIRLGTMDFHLIKPVDTQLLISTRNLNLFRLIDMVTGVGLVAWAAANIPQATWAGAGLMLALALAALAIVYAIWFLLSTTAFWFVKVQNVTELFNGFFRAGQFPVSAYPGWVRGLFTFVLPIAFITTVPAEALTGRLAPSTALAAAAIAIALLSISRWFWRVALRSYTSASS